MIASSSFDLLAVYANFSVSSESGGEGALKALHVGGGECYWAVVI